jgi:hypothetical protein
MRVLEDRALKFSGREISARHPCAGKIHAAKVCVSEGAASQITIAKASRSFTLISFK